MLRVAFVATLLMVLGGGCKKDQAPAEAPVSNASPEPPEARPGSHIDERDESGELTPDEEQANARVGVLEVELRAVHRDEERAMKALDDAQTQADRDAANARRVDLSRQRSEVEQRLRDARAAASKAQPNTGVKIRQECIDNPLAKGCE